MRIRQYTFCCCCFFPSLTTRQTPWNPFKDVGTATTITRVPSNTWSAVFKTSSPVTVESSQKINRQKERPLSASTVNVVETMENIFPFTTVQRDPVLTSAAITKHHYHICLWTKIKQFFSPLSFPPFFFFFLNELVTATLTNSTIMKKNQKHTKVQI